MESGLNTNFGRGVLVHEWYESAGGAEKVFDTMMEAFPEADVLTLWNEDGSFPGRQATETWIAKTSLRNRKALAVPAILPTWRFQSGAYDWALVSTHNFAHHVNFGAKSPDLRKFLYVHSPARYVWTPEIDQRGNNLGVRAVAPALRHYDRYRAQEAHAIAANSAYVADRVRMTWGLESNVIYPPVDVTKLLAEEDWRTKLEGSDRATFDALPKQFVMGASRFVPYKRLDAAILAGEAAGLPVVIAGRGPEEANLRAVARDVRVPVHFVVSPSDALLYAMIQRAVSFVFLALEDFGILPVEAMALGTPVICLDIGGASESVIDGLTGVHVSVVDDCKGLSRAVHMAAALSSADCVGRAREFSRERFLQSLHDFVGSGPGLILPNGAVL